MVDRERPPMERQRHSVDSEGMPFPPFPVEEDRALPEIVIDVDANANMEDVRRELCDGLNDLLVDVQQAGSPAVLITINLVHGMHHTVLVDRELPDKIPPFALNQIVCQGFYRGQQQTPEDAPVKIGTLTQSVDANGAWNMSGAGISVNQDPNMFHHAAADILDAAALTIPKTRIAIVNVNRLSHIFAAGR